MKISEIEEYFRVPNLNVDNLKNLDFYLSKRPTYCDMIKYYWTALINNQHHKMNYIQFKSRIHRFEIYIDYYVRKGFVSDDAGVKDEDNDIQIAYNIIHRVEWVLTEYGHLLWTTRAPYEEFIHKYIFFRNDILEINKVKKDNDENEEIEESNIRTNVGLPPKWDITYYKPLRPRDNSRLIKHSVYMALDVFTMLEFMKNDIDRNDELLFKLIILSINGLIFIGQFLWDRYIQSAFYTF